jgi:hypothetical protein
VAVAGMAQARPSGGPPRQLSAGRLAAPDAVPLDPTDGDVARAATLRAFSPDERLRAAVLVNALMDLRRYPPTTREGAEVRAWFASEEAWWPCAFVCICDVFGLDPAAVRARVSARGICTGQTRA